jgi:hypothetical protein
MEGELKRYQKPASADKFYEQSAFSEKAGIG